MILQNLLEDKRLEWQRNTQEEILNGLLCKSHKYKSLGQRNDKLVMVFGKSHSGKTTFILSLMGVLEKKLSELNLLLRADIPEGKSSTSTAIIYQKSEDDNFGVCERGINEVLDFKVRKCSMEEFKKKIQEIRTAVETHNRDENTILYLYIPRRYFRDCSENREQIYILDVPGYETTNQEERYHTEALLNKYMSVSVLNIVIRSIYDINDLQYFRAPNRDDFNKLSSGKYIIVATRAYSQESIFKYFLQPREQRDSTFEEMLEKQCKILFERVFGNNVPAYFPIDIGESFYELINTKIVDPIDRDDLVNYRVRIFEQIYEYISRKQSNLLVSWVQEVIEDEEYYGNIEGKVIEESIERIVKALDMKHRQLEKRKGYINRLNSIKEAIQGEIKELVRKMDELAVPNYNELIEKKVAEYQSDNFTKDYKWKNKAISNDVSVLFATIFSELLSELIKMIETEHYGIITESELYEWRKNVGNVELDIRRALDEIFNPHKVLKVLNPSNKEKMELGQGKLLERVPAICTKILAECKEKYNSAIDQKTKGIIRLTILAKVNEDKVYGLQGEIEKLLFDEKNHENQKKAIKRRVEKDKGIISEYIKIAKRHYYVQRDAIIKLMNKAKSADEKLGKH